MNTTSDDFFQPKTEYLMVLLVSAFCPWEQGEVAELDRESSRYSPCDWQKIAAISVDAVRADKQATQSVVTWNSFGARAGLEGDDLQAFDSLYACPIEVYPEAWINGRHRGLLVQRSGATHVAGHNPLIEP